MLLSRNVRYFLIAGEEEHFHRAAERLHMAQPALSRRILDLELELGVQLFERLGRGVRLTDVGRVFLRDLKQISASIDRAKERVQRAAKGLVGELRIGFNEVAARHQFVPESFQTFRTLNPEVELELSLMHSEAQIALLRKGGLDAGIMFQRPHESAEFDFLELYVDDVVVALSKYHPLAEAEKIDFRELANEDFVWIKRELGASFYDRLMAACSANGFTPKIVQEVGEGDSVLALVSTGMGIGIVHSVAKSRWSEGVVYKQAEGLSVPMRLELVWRRDRPSHILDRFISHLAEMIGIERDLDLHTSEAE
jgi:DNA-binding transcriptional LysR family regulator